MSFFKNLDKYKIILASKSPRRQHLLADLGIDFEIETREVEEVYPESLAAEKVPEYLAKLKAAPFLNELNSDKLVITSDTVVCVGDEILGKPGDHHTEIHAILAEYGLPSEFPDEVESYANSLDTSIKQEEILKRKDLRKTLTCTIDPRDAKDFDDALSFEILDNGNYSIGIHIADVSHYLKPDTILEQEAYERATSVYLVDRVVPMLPEVLSNNACSLRPLEDKYTFSAIFEMDKNGSVKNQWFGRTVINSNERFAYEEAQHIIETGKGLIPESVSIRNKAYSVSEETVYAISTLNSLAKKM